MKPSEAKAEDLSTAHLIHRFARATPLPSRRWDAPLNLIENLIRQTLFAAREKLALFEPNVSL